MSYSIHVTNGAGRTTLSETYETLEALKAAVASDLGPDGLSSRAHERVTAEENPLHPAFAGKRD